MEGGTIVVVVVVLVVAMVLVVVAVLEPSRTHLWAMCGGLGAMLSPFWVYGVPSRTYVGLFCAIYVDIFLRCDVFCPGPPLRGQIHVKTHVFYRQDEIHGGRRAKNLVKHSVFEHHARKAP